MSEGEGLSQGWSAVGWAGNWLQSPGGGSEGLTNSETVNSAPLAQATCCWPC